MTNLPNGHPWASTRLAESHVLLHIRLFDSPQQERALARRALTIEALTASVFKEFARDEQLDETRQYALYQDGEPLDAATELSTLPDEAVLVFSYADSDFAVGGRAPQSRTVHSVTLEPLSGGRMIIVGELPAILGRPDTQAPTDEKMIDLSNQPNSKSISRRHARLAARGSRVTVESLRAHNPVLVNGVPVPVGEACPANDGDEIQLGKLAFVLRVQVG